MSNEQQRTISLIGMPGVGKSTVGVLLAKRCGLRFVDSDLDIQVAGGTTLQELLERDGYRALRALEERVLLQLPLPGAVLSTGGSAVYSVPVMNRLAAAGPVIYLRASLDTLQCRVAANPLRGIASDGAQSFADIYRERTPLYQQFATLQVDTEQRDPERIVDDIVAALG